MIEQYLTNQIKKIFPNINIKFKKSNIDGYDLQSSILFNLNDDEKKMLFNILDNNKIIKNYSITGKNFLNLNINLTHYLENFLNEIDLNNKPKTVLIDYCGINVAKQMHIGHIRSMFIGDYIVSSHLFQNDNVIIQNHIGDWGVQFGYLIQYIIDNNILIKNNKQLSEIYKKSYSLYLEDKNFAEKSALCSKKLFHKDKQIVDIWNKCVTISLDEAQNIFNLFNLHISLKDTCGESFFSDKVENVIKILLDKNIAKVDDNGCVFVSFDKLSTIVLKKSDGVYLYPAYDLAAIYYRVEKYNPDKIVYVVDKRQELHFKQVFEIAEIAGFCTKDKLLHVPFGTILGDNKKPIKTRSGQSLYLDDLVDDGFNFYKHTEIYKKQDSVFIDKYSIDKKTVIGALKYYDLHLESSKDYVFKWENVLNTQGQSAPYFQNTIVRIDSIFEKIEIDLTKKIINSDFTINNYINFLKEIKYDKIIINNDSKDILFDCLNVTNEILKQNIHYNSYQLINSMLDLSKKFHSFYEKTNILKSQDDEKESAIELIKFILINISFGLKNLNVDFYLSKNNLEKNNKIKP